MMTTLLLFYTVLLPIFRHNRGDTGVQQGVAGSQGIRPFPRQQHKDARHYRRLVDRARWRPSAAAAIPAAPTQGLEKLQTPRICCSSYP